MKNLWPESFSESDIKAAKIILDEQATLLNKITGGIVDAGVAELSNMEKSMNSVASDFSYSFNLIGRYIENYTFRVFIFWHDIGLYPVAMRMDEHLAKELNLPTSLKISDQEQFLTFLERALQSKRIKNVVASILSLSK